MAEKQEKNKPNLAFKIGILLIVGALLLLWIIFYPTIRNEAKYLFSKKTDDVQIVFGKEDQGKNEIIPVDKNFSLIIPKIGANVKVIQDVDPLNEAEYRTKLKEGVVHAKGSGLPNDDQTVFIFAHSSDNFYQNNQYNSIFYLLRKLENGDVFHLVHKGKVYNYEMTGVKTVDAEEVDYLENNDKYDAILMTCWPPGTAHKRLLVFGKKI